MSVGEIREIEKMKKIVLTIITILLTVYTAAFAADNFLNTVILEGTGSENYNIILRSDAIASVKRIVENPNKITLEIRGLTASENLSTAYKNTPAANGIIVENSGNNFVKVHVRGKNIAEANVIFDSPAAAPVVVPDGISKNTVCWSILAGLVLCIILAKSRNIRVDSKAKIKAAVQKNMRNREIEMYKNYRRELLTIPSIDYKVKNPRVKQAIRRADTIRHLQRVTGR